MRLKAPTLDDLRRYTVARSLFAPTSLPKALLRLGFVQADPIRAPARAQDLTLRHRVRNYRAGDLDRRYPRLDVDEDFFVNYGFLPRATVALMHPRTPGTAWPATRWQLAKAVLAFVRERGVVHPREVDAQFQHGKASNWFGGSSNASTQLLDDMHYRGLLRTVRREAGVRLYGLREPALPAPDPVAAYDQLVDVAVQLYAPLPELSLNALVARVRYGAPQWTALARAAAARARQRLPSAEAGGLRWYWPEGENPASRRHAAPEAVRLLAPFDPVVWDRRRFEALWGWAYRFEAYTPAARRLRGYYALPLLWRDEVVGWSNLSLQAGELQARCGFVAGQAPPEAAFTAALQAELDEMAAFLGATSPGAARALQD